MNDNYEWAVIGAGPAGIASIGKLLDLGVQPHQIVWIDPAFRVGDFGTLWQEVSSNTRVKLFVKFFDACSSFRYREMAENFGITHYDPEATCPLKIAAEALQWITEHLKKEVIAIQSSVKYLKFQDQKWHLSDEHFKIKAKKVILAIGAEPRSLDYSGPSEIALNIALNPNLLKKACDPGDNVAVFGSSHSAIIILKTLLEIEGINKVINFYRSPLRYAVELKGWTLYDDTGLKGETAAWAKNHMDSDFQKKLHRIITTPKEIEQWLPQCNKIIYAVGFEKRTLVIEGLSELEHDPYTGIIAPGLFGFGIAFPSIKENPLGLSEHRVGLWKFMEHLTKVLPIWMNYP